MKKQFKKIYIEITNICNLECSFCMPDNRKKEYMSKENFLKVLENIQQYTDYIYLHVKGEPLIHPYINEFIDFAYERGFKVNITTNGTCIDKLKTKNIRQINYSMQSAKNVNQMQEIIQKMKKYIDNTDIYLSIRLWIDNIKLNKEVEQMLKNEFSENIQIEDKKQLDKKIFLSVENEFVWPDNENPEKSINGYCHALKDHIGILVDGTIIPCCLDHKGEIKLGNIFEEDLGEVLESKRTKNIVIGFKNRIAIEKLCTKCNFKNRF